MDQGILAGYPVKGLRVRLVDGAFHTVDSSELAFKLAGSIAMKQALEQASPVLLEPIMMVTLSVPEETVGDVIGDLNSRRGRPQGMERIGAMAEIKAELPMAELLGYAPDLRSMTGGQGDYTMEFLRYEEVPGHLVSRVLDAASRSRRGSEAIRPQRQRVAAGPAVRWRPCGLPRSPDQSRDGDVRDLRALAPARRVRDDVPERHRAPSGLRAVHGARFGEGWVREGTAIAGPRRRARRAPARSSAACGRASRTRTHRRRAAASARPRCAARAPRPRGPAEVGGTARARGRAFNASEHPKLVAGVIRSLGAPHVTLGPSTRSSSSTILVAWELCWYRFEADLDGEVVRKRAQGYELTELEGELGQPNAAATPDGGLALPSERLRGLLGRPSPDLRGAPRSGVVRLGARFASMGW